MDLNQKSKFTLFAPAKINLRLKIVGRREDGYHDLDMVMVTLDLYDEIGFEIGGKGIHLFCDDSRLVGDSSNTAWKAARLIQEESKKDFGITLTIKKRIPMGAGLGGGSSDAATVLKGLNKALNLGWSQERLKALGVKIGADVPFFLTEGSQHVRGIGDILSPLTIPPLQVILMNPGFPVSTKDVYGWYDEVKREFGLTRSNLGASCPPIALENDLERVVIPRYPVLAEMKELLSQAGALGTLMSGSGSTVFGLFESPALQDRGYEILQKKKDPRWWICKTQSVG